MSLLSKSRQYLNTNFEPFKHLVFKSPIYRRITEYPTNKHIHIQDGESYLKYDRHSMQYARSILDAPTTMVGEKWGGRNPIFYNYDSSLVNSLSTQLKVFKGSPEIKTLEDVIYMPQYNCLYSSDGLRIRNSRLDRTPGSQLLKMEAPDKIVPPQKLTRIKQKFIYGGLIWGHYGHLLTSDIARLWYAAKDERYPILCHGVKQKTIVDIFFRSINLDLRRFISFNYPVLLQEVILPYPSISLERKGEQQREIFEVHKFIPENVAQNMLSERQPSTSQPIYLSRAKLNKKNRLVVNEDKLENALREKGVYICYPETLSLKEQINLINKHEVVIGTRGSALHSILFDISPRRNMVCFAGKKAPCRNQLIIDTIKSVNSMYIGALEKDPNCSKPQRWSQNLILDLDIALDALREQGLF